MPSLVFLQVFGDAVGPLALLVGLRPGLARGLGDSRHLAGFLDQVEGFLDFRRRLRGWGLSLSRRSGARGVLELVQAALGLVGFAAKANGAAAKAEDAG